MGKWDRRYYRPRFSRRDYRDYDWSPPRDEPCPDPESEEWQDNVPMWEKKFCYMVGRMPWKKVLSTKTFIHCHSNILSWDDSAGKDAFDNAKKGFWEEINGLPSASELPNPDMYNHEVDWNPYIDPELVKELDHAYFNPDDRYYLPSERSSKGNNRWQDSDTNPWEQSQLQTSEVKDKATGWDNWVGDDKNNPETLVNDGWDSHAKDSQAVRDSSWGGGHNSWGAKPEQHTDAEKNWSSGRDNSWGAKPENRSDVGKDWSSNGPNSSSWRNNGKQWQDRGSHSKNWNQKSSELHRPNHQNNKYRPPQGYGSHQGVRGPSRGNSWGQKRWDNNSMNNTNNNRGNNWETRGGQFNASCRKREGPDQYAVNHKGPRLQGGESHSSRDWNEAHNNEKVTFGGQWS